MQNSASDRAVAFRHPDVGDGARVWQITRDSQALDVNSPYAYLLWCRDFAATSVVAVDEGDVVGFATGYRRPDTTDTYLLWQIAVDGVARGRGIAGAMLDWIFATAQRAHPGLTHLETTITDDNVASRRLFGAFAERHHASMVREPLFTEAMFPTDSGEDHAAEQLHRIGPIHP